jgi:hypothetical protein
MCFALRKTTSRGCDAPDVEREVRTLRATQRRRFSFFCL